MLDQPIILPAAKKDKSGALPPGEDCRECQWHFTNRGTWIAITTESGRKVRAFMTKAQLLELLPQLVGRMHSME